MAILNFYGVDPLHMYARSSDQMATIYLSTIGNINFLGTFLCLSLPLFLYHAIYQKSLLQRIIFSIVTCIGLAAAIVVNSDSMYFGLMLVIVIIICMRGFNICLANSLLTIGAVFSFECFILGIFASKMANKYQALRSISKLLCNAYVSIFLLLLCVVLIAVISLCKKQKRKILYADISKITRIVCLIFAVIICSLIIYVNIIKPTADFKTFNNLFVFNDTWGSNRGYVWGRLLYRFGEAPLWQKLFGVGPDSVNFLINPNYTKYIIAMNGSTFDSAHNEYLQYLLCIGLIGLGSYLAFTASILQKTFKAKKHMANGFALCICAYLAQAIFNIAMPITTPLFFIICALAVTSAKRKVKVQQ
ncbi:MAG: O-antigen ligase family protein [Oscillospiraceae bacterium]